MACPLFLLYPSISFFTLSSLPTDYTDFTDLFSEVRRFGGQPLRGRGYEISLSAHCRGRPPCLPVVSVVCLRLGGWRADTGVCPYTWRSWYSRTSVPSYPRTTEKCYSMHPPFLLLFATQELSIINCQLSIINCPLGPQGRFLSPRCYESEQVRARSLSEKELSIINY